MSENKVEVIIKGQDEVSVSMDVLDFPYRLNRVSFTTSRDRLKTLGGTSSTSMKFSKSKKNNKVFLGKTDFKSVAKFNLGREYEGIIIKNGSEAARGIFRLEGVSNIDYTGTFFDEDSGWVEQLANVMINRLGYVDGSPTWLVPFDGALTINSSNILTNRQTDFLCPTIIYNNTPIKDYFDFTEDEIWGTFDGVGRLTNALPFPSSFFLKHGSFSGQLGSKFSDFPPALYYRNVIERIFAEIGLAVECPLFDLPEFNAIYEAYTGDGYRYNWKNLASVFAELLENAQGRDTVLATNTIDATIIHADLDLQNIEFIAAANANPWILNPVATYAFCNTIEYDDTATLVDKVVAVNSFNMPNKYVVQTDGEHTISVKNAFRVQHTDFVTVPDGFPDQQWNGWDLLDSYATQEANSSKGTAQIDRHFGWDDHILLILRKDSTGGTNQETLDKLFQWKSGENKDFINIPSDVIAYLSPKRFGIGPANQKESFGSPITNWESEVSVVASDTSHFISTNTDDEKTATSSGNMSVTLDLVKGDIVEIFWVSLNLIGGQNTLATNPTSISHNKTDLTTNRDVGGDPPEYSISYNCGEFDLNLAENLPKISAKEYISSFIKGFNLHFSRKGDTVLFTPVKQFYISESYDITPRVDVSKGWNSDPIDTPREWIIGYNIDPKDRLLIENNEGCVQDESGVTQYGNISFNNDNIYSNRTLEDLVFFSSTRFSDSVVRLIDHTTATPGLPTSTDPASGFVLNLGISWNFGQVLEFIKFPSIQSSESFSQETFGDLVRDYNYVPRLLMHLGTINSHYGLNSNVRILVDCPRADANFIKLGQHWIQLTASRFDNENPSLPVGLNDFPTLRYDTDNGLFNRLFENLLELYNLSDILTLKMSIRPKDWANLKGPKRVRFLDQLYRLMEIKDYDPVTNELAIIKLLREL